MAINSHRQGIQNLVFPGRLFLLMKRGVGISGLDNANQITNSFQETGQEFSTTQLEQLKKQFDTFKSGLEAFAKTYRRQIDENPAFRAHFTKMCLEIGVDPLSSSKGFWAETLGIGDFYYELAVQVIEVCFTTREQNGGLIELKVLLEKLEKFRGRQATKIDEFDVIRAIEALEPLGSGYKVIKTNNLKFVQSIPRAFSLDQTLLLTAARTNGLLEPATSWTQERFEAAVKGMIEDSLVWIDGKTGTGRTEYYLVSFI